MYRITFYSYSKALGEGFYNTELHRDMASANLRAMALGWQIYSVEIAEKVEG